MNSKRHAQLRISPLHIQQGLFASLAVLITLIVIQQFQQWDNKREAAQIKQPFTSSQSYSTASAPRARDAALSLTPVDGKALASETQQRQTWVF
jgi:cytoskeletal protein RodZ